MEVNILRISTNSLVEANIRKAISSELPSMHDGWQFNFDKQIRKLGNASAYIIACADSPETTEGCIILQFKDNLPAYLAFIEIAPHNKTIPKAYDYVAGCLLAFAYHQSVVKQKVNTKASSDLMLRNQIRQTNRN